MAQIPRSVPFIDNPESVISNLSRKEAAGDHEEVGVGERLAPGPCEGRQGTLLAAAEKPRGLAGEVGFTGEVCWVPSYSRNLKSS